MACGNVLGLPKPGLSFIYSGNVIFKAACRINGPHLSSHESAKSIERPPNLFCTHAACYSLSVSDSHRLSLACPPAPCEEPTTLPDSACAAPVTGHGVTAPPVRNAGGGYDEQPSKLHPTWVLGVISVAPGADELLLERPHAVPFASSPNVTATLLFNIWVGVQLATLMIAMRASREASGIVLL